MQNLEARTIGKVSRRLIPFLMDYKGCNSFSSEWLVIYLACKKVVGLKIIPAPLLGFTGGGRDFADHL